MQWNHNKVMKLQVVDNLTNEIIEYDMTLREVPMGKKWIVGVMILTTLWTMTGCGKQEMIRCEYTNEAAGFTLSIDRPVEWTAKLVEGWPATETEEASPDEGIRIYTDDSQESSIYFCNSFSPYYAGDENDLETVEVNEELTALHGIETSGEGVRESYVFKGDFTGQGFYNITISMSQKDYKKYKKIISQMVASCQIREWEPENATVSESIENVENTENNDLMIRGTLLDRESERAVYNDITGMLNERYDLLNELLSAWDFTVDSRDSISVSLPDGRETVMYRVKVADSWEYYEQKAENIYDDIYIQEVFTPCYLGNLYAEVDGKLYRAEADGFAWGIDEDSIKIWKQDWGNRYIATAKEQNEMTTDVLFIIRKEDTDNNYEIVDEVEMN